MRLAARVASLALIVVAPGAAPLHAQSSAADSTDDLRVFHLGEVLVTAQRDPGSFTSLSGSDLTALGRVDVAHALDALPGVTLNTVAGRNESTLYVRGFDLRQVPLLVDGIPVYVPYDGYVDLGRFITAGLARISVAKGFSSMLNGPNAEGGAINLVTRKPEARVEYGGRLGTMSGSGRAASLDLGSRQDAFYVTGALSRVQQETYPLSGGFTATPTQAGTDRGNAARKDTRVHLKAGLTPSPGSEYAIGFTDQRGSKGNPVYTGSDPSVKLRYWRWPQWDKQSAYFLSQSELTQRVEVDTRLFYDTFKNTLDAYDDATYTTQTKSSAFTSIYDDYTVGGSAQVGVESVGRGRVKGAVHLKYDVHREHNVGEPERRVSDNTASFGVESTQHVTERVALVPGFCYDLRNSLHADDYNGKTGAMSAFPDNDDAALNAQVAALVAVSAQQQVTVSVARRTRFATMKDRYSYKMGAAIPNPALDAEACTNVEAAYACAAADGRAAVQVSLFHAGIRDIIQRVDNVQPGTYQLRNAGKARFMGGELGLALRPVRGLSSGLSYSYVNRRNTSHPELKLVDVPRHKVVANATFGPVQRVALHANAEYNSWRYATSAGRRLDAFTLVNGRLTAQLPQQVGLELGITNLFDANYSLAEGYPEAGRGVNAALVFGTP